MFNSSPIEAWEGAAAIFTWAGSGGAVLWFWVMVALCIIPIVTSLRAENEAERNHGAAAGGGGGGGAAAGAAG